MVAAGAALLGLAAWQRKRGLYALATLPGLADVDSIIISVMKMQAADNLEVTPIVAAVGLSQPVMAFRLLPARQPPPS